MAELYLDRDLNGENVCRFLQTRLGCKQFVGVEGAEEAQTWIPLCDQRQGRGVLRLLKPRARDDLLCVVESTGERIRRPEFERWCHDQKVRSRHSPRRLFIEQRFMDRFSLGVATIREQQLEPMRKKLRDAEETLILLSTEVTKLENQVKEGLENATKCRVGLGQKRVDWELSVTMGMVDEQPILVIRWNAWREHHKVLQVDARFNNRHHRHLILFQSVSFVPLPLAPQHQVTFYSLDNTQLSRHLVLTRFRSLLSLHLAGVELFEEVQTCLQEVLQEVGADLHCQGAELVRKAVVESNARGEAVWQYLVNK